MTYRETAGTMENQPEEKVFTAKGVMITVLYFSIYGVILFSLDPDWIMWAVPMVMGALYVPDPPPPNCLLILRQPSRWALFSAF